MQVLTSGSAAPATAYWSGAQGTHWSDTNAAQTQGNFTTDAAGTTFVQAYPAATTDVFFAASNATNLANNTLGQNFDIHSLTFLGSGPAAGTATNIGGANVLSIEGGGLTQAAGNAGATLSMATLGLGTSESFTNASSNPLTISAASLTSNETAGVTTLTLSNTGSGATNISSAITNGGVANKLALLVNNTGSGVTTLSGANTFTGGITLNSGTLRAASAGALGTNALAFGAGSTGDLQLNGNSVTTGGLNTDPTVGTPVIENGNGAAAVTLTNNLTTGTANYGGVIQDGAGSGALAFTETGGGVQTLSGANTYTGGTTVNAAGGGLALGAGGTLGASTSNTTVTAGTLDLGGQSVTQNALTLGGGTVVGPTGTLALTSLVISSGAYTFAAPAETAGLALNGGSIIKSATAGNPTLSGSIALNGGTNTVALADTGGDNFPELTLSGVISGPGALAQDNTVGGFSTQEFGSLLLSNANTYTGGTSINVGRLEVANNAALGTGLVTIGTRGTLALGGGQVRNVNNGDLTIANNLTIGHTVSGNYGQDAIQSNFGTDTLAGTIALTASTQVNAGSPLIFSGQVTASGAGTTFTKVGGGTLTVTNTTGPNTFDTATGYPAFVVNNGSVVFGAIGATASGQVDNITGELTVGGTGAGGNNSLILNSGDNQYHRRLRLHQRRARQQHDRPNLHHHTQYGCRPQQRQRRNGL